MGELIGVVNPETIYLAMTPDAYSAAFQSKLSNTQLDARARLLEESGVAEVLKGIVDGSKGDVSFHYTEAAGIYLDGVRPGYRLVDRDSKKTVTISAGENSLEVSRTTVTEFVSRGKTGYHTEFHDDHLVFQRGKVDPVRLTQYVQFARVPETV